MEKSTKEIKDRVLSNIPFMLLVFLLLSNCKSYNLMNKNEGFNLTFSSIYEKDTCNLKVNDSVVFSNKLIITNNELGISNTFLNLPNLKKIDFSISFISTLKTRFGNESRNVNLDTIIYSKNGKHLLIEARFDKIIIFQQKKEFTYD